MSEIEPQPSAAENSAPESPEVAPDVAPENGAPAENESPEVPPSDQSAPPPADSESPEVSEPVAEAPKKVSFVANLTDITPNFTDNEACSLRFDYAGDPVLKSDSKFGMGMIITAEAVKLTAGRRVRITIEEI